MTLSAGAETPADAGTVTAMVGGLNSTGAEAGVVASEGFRIASGSRTGASGAILTVPEDFSGGLGASFPGSGDFLGVS